MNRVAQGGRHYLGKAEREIRNARAIELFEQGLKPDPISKRLGVSVNHVRNVLRGAGYSPRQRMVKDAKIRGS